MGALTGGCGREARPDRRQQPRARWAKKETFWSVRVERGAGRAVRHGGVRVCANGQLVRPPSGGRGDQEGL